MSITILLSKVVGKQKTKTDGSNSIFNVVGKRKTKRESRIPFSDDAGKRKTKLEIRIPFSYFAGKRLKLRYTHSNLFLNQSMKRLFRWKQISPPLKLTTKRPRCITVSENGSIRVFSRKLSKWGPCKIQYKPLQFCGPST